MLTNDFIPESFRQLSLLSLLLRFVLSLLCGGLIGLERGSKRRAAGFRTHILVCIGSCMAMMTGQYVYEYMGATADPTRLGAQVISGIGFLGVGTIITTNYNKVKGLTTAAGLWAAACIGLAIGIGFYEAAVIGTAAVLLSIVVLHKLDEFFYARSPITDLFVELMDSSCVAKLLSNIRNHNLKILSMEVQKSHIGGTGIGISITVKKCNRRDSCDVVQAVSETEGLIFIEEIL